MENWKDISKDYQVSDQGRIRRLWICLTVEPEKSNTFGKWNVRPYFENKHLYLGTFDSYESAKAVLANEVQRLNSLKRVRKYLDFSIDKDGYFKVHLLNDIQKLALVSRLVATYFIPNPLNKPMVNHINGIKQDNRVCNLEWATAKENLYHAYDTGLFTEKHTMKRVRCSNGAIYINAIEAAIAINAGGANITTLARGIRKAVQSGKPYKELFWYRTFND